MSVIRIKRRATGDPGAPGSLANAEIAYNEIDDVLYYGKGGNSTLANSVIAISGQGAYVTRSTNQTISGEKTFNAAVFITTADSSDNSTRAASTAFVKAQNYLTGNQSISISGDATGSGTTSISITLANVVTAGTGTKLTYNSKGLITGSAALSASDIPSITASKISDFNDQVRLNRLDQLAAPTADLNLNGYKITNLAEPTAATDAVTKNYVDSVATGLNIKDSVRALASSNITLSGLFTVDDVSLVEGDRVLVIGQTNRVNNGIYVASVSNWVRSSDADNTPTVGEVTSGMFTFVEEGTNYGNTGWVLATSDPIIIGGSELEFTQFSGSGSITAGNGLTQSGSTFNVNGTANRITVTSDSVDIAANYAGQSSISTVGTITTGTWHGNIISLAYGGTGADLSALADGSFLKKQGTALVAATAGVDFLSASDVIDGGVF